MTNTRVSVLAVLIALPLAAATPFALARARAARVAITDEVAVPVLLVCGLADAVYQQPSSCQQQGQEYSASPDETTTFIAQAGHALTPERSAPATRGQVGAWLTRHGF